MSSSAPFAPNAHAANAGAILAAKSYVRERTTPRLRDLSYVILLDVRQFILGYAARIKGNVFDYGCGGTPYRKLFVNAARYVGADMLPGEAVDVVLAPDGMTNEPADKYQAVLSSQVLEHLPEPEAYLRECCRIIAPGGILILTTHGLFPEHKCPDDYFRWTPQGLEKLVSASGFEVENSTKISCGLRGGIQLLHYIVNTFHEYPRTFTGYSLRALGKVYRAVLLPGLNGLSGAVLGWQGLLPGDHPERVYLGVGIIARKK